jgi:hypothetical protein
MAFSNLAQPIDRQVDLTYTVFWSQNIKRPYCFDFNQKYRYFQSTRCKWRFEVSKVVLYISLH